jgi:hypothetical protein
MKIISHRGNINGIVTNKENRPSYIDCAVQLGLEVEVDLRYQDGNFWLGHDTADYIITADWIAKRANSLWFHCKNINAVHKLKDLSSQIKYFCHSSDPYVPTSTGHLWVHDLSATLNNNCIIPLLGDTDIDLYHGAPVYAICTDYVSYCKYKFKI